MTPPPASQGGAASHARFAGVSPLLRSSDCFRLVFAHSADHNPPYPPLVSALRLVCSVLIPGPEESGPGVPNWDLQAGV